MSDFFIQKNSRIIDVGCSSGNYLSKLYDKNKFDISLAFEGYDAVPEMIKFCKKKYNKKKINFFKKDVVNINFKNSSLISSFYTIQFIKQSKRQKLINRIYNGLNKNGAFFLLKKFYQKILKHKICSLKYITNLKLKMVFHQPMF